MSTSKSAASLTRSRDVICSRSKTLRLVGVGEQVGVFSRDVGRRLRRHLPLLFDPCELLQVGDAVKKSGKELNGDLLRVLRVDVPLHHADNHLLKMLNIDLSIIARLGQ